MTWRYRRRERRRSEGGSSGSCCPAWRPLWRVSCPPTTPMCGHVMVACSASTRTWITSWATDWRMSRCTTSRETTGHLCGVFATSAPTSPHMSSRYSHCQPHAGFNVNAFMFSQRTNLKYLKWGACVCAHTTMLPCSRLCFLSFMSHLPWALTL